MNISIALVDDLKLRQRREHEILGVCPVCGCKDANFNTAKLKWRCWHCFTGDAVVWTANGIKNIPDVLVGDWVLTENGVYKPVIDTHSNMYHGDMVIIKSTGLLGDISSTSDHIYYVLEHFKRHKSSKIDWNRKDEFYVREVEARNLKRGDWLVYPIAKSYCTDTNITTVTYTKGRKLLPQTLEITKDLLRIAGLYIAEGSSYRGGIQFSFAGNEQHLAIEVKRFFTNLGLTVSTANSYKDSQLVIKVSNTHLQKTFEHWFGIGCDNKRIPTEFTNLPNELTDVLLSGIFDGDGDERGNLEQTSLTLAYQVSQLLSRISPVSSRRIYRYGRKMSYNVRKCSYNNSINSYAVNFGKWFRLIEIDEVLVNYHVTEMVYDITVDGTEKFTVNGVLVHNCPAKGGIIPEEGYEVKEVEDKVLDIPKVRELYDTLAGKYHDNITQPVVEYLKARGLTQQTIDDFKLGFCSTDFYSEYTNPIAEDAGIVYQNYPALTNRVTIPYLVNGKVTDLRGRILNTVFQYKENTPTYVSLSGNHASRGATFLFNHDVIGKSDRVILTEGEFKAIVGYQHGFPIVATPGIFGWQKEWSALLKDKETILAADFDRISGLRSPAYLMTKMLIRELPNLKVALLQWAGHTTTGKIDIDSLLVNGNVHLFERAINGALDARWWLKREETKGYGGRKER